MYKLFTALCVAGGIALFSCGLLASQAHATELSRFLAGTFQVNTVWLLVGGGLLLFLGLAATVGFCKEVA